MLCDIPHRQKSGIWGFRSDRVENISGYDTKVSTNHPPPTAPPHSLLVFLPFPSLSALSLSLPPSFPLASTTGLFSLWAGHCDQDTCGAPP